MRDDRIVRAYAPVAPSPEVRASMLGHILESKGAPSQAGTRKRSIASRWFLPAACAAAVFLCIFTVPQLYSPEQPSIVIQQVAPGADSPNGIRKTMNYNGFRYVFLENGATYDLDPSVLSQPLGTLNYNIQQDPKTYGSTDFAASFAVGGTVYQIDGYDPAFRLAVEWEGQYYIAQCVDTLDNTALELSTYFETAELEDRTEEVQICDHAGQSILSTLTGDDAEALISLLTQSISAELTNDQYQEIARAQRSGESYQLMFRLKDSTSYTMYVIPALSIVSAGDNRYLVPEEYAQDLKNVFSELPQTPLPMG